MVDLRRRGKAARKRKTGGAGSRAEQCVCISSSEHTIKIHCAQVLSSGTNKHHWTVFAQPFSLTLPSTGTCECVTGTPTIVMAGHQPRARDMLPRSLGISGPATRSRTARRVPASRAQSSRNDCRRHGRHNPARVLGSHKSGASPPSPAPPPHIHGPASPYSVAAPSTRVHAATHPSLW